MTKEYSPAPYSGFMRQFDKARREVATLKRLYPHACKWATLRFPAPPVDQQKPAP